MSQDQRRSDTPSPGEVPPEILGAPSIAAPATETGDIVSTNAPRLEAAHSSFAEFHQGYVSNYIALADTKAAWTFTIAAGLIAYIFTSEELQKVMFLPSWSLPFVLLVVTTILLAASAVFSFFVISPRVARPSEQTVFFKEVAKRDSAERYVRDIASMDEARLTEARLKHSYDISRICATKYGHLRWAFRAGIAALICMACLVLIV